MVVKRVAAVVLVAVALACSTAALPAAEPAPVPATAASAGVVPPVLSLDQAIAIAIRNNPVVEVSNQQIRANAGLVEQATSAGLPHLNMSITRSTTVDAPAASFQAQGTTWQTDVQLTQALYTWGAVAKGTRAAQQLLQASRASFVRTQDQVAFQTRQDYYQVITSQASVLVQQEVLSAAQEHLRIAGLRFGAGVAPQYDVLAAEARVARVQQQVAAAQGGLNVAWASLSRAMGVEVPTSTQLSTPLPLTRAEASLPDLVTEAEASRADIQAARAQVAANEARVAVARTGNLPQISALASYAYRPSTTISGEAIGGAPGTQLVVSQNSGLVALTASWDLYSGGRVHGEIETAEAQAEQSRQDLRSLEQQSEFEVRNAYFDVQSAQSQVTAAQKEVEQAQEASRIANVRYQEGVGTSVEVLDAQTNLGDARNRLNEAIFGLNLAVAQLDLATGRHLEQPLAPGPRSPGCG